MHAAIAVLMEEHRIIERVLGSLESYALALESGSPLDRETIRSYGDFFRLFADRCHHGKEEDLLFAWMARRGFPTEYGPIAVMLSDHVEGRACVAALVRAGEGVGPASEAQRIEVVEAARLYIPLLRAHILKEDNILYPMALQVLPPAQQEELADAYRAFEREAMGEGEHERLHALAERLCAAYPPDPTAPRRPRSASAVRATPEAQGLNSPLRKASTFFSLTLGR